MDSSTGNFTLRHNGSDYNATANAADYKMQYLFYYGNASLWTKGSIKEHIIYDASKYNDRTGIESNINTYYSIY